MLIPKQAIPGNSAPTAKPTPQGGNPIEKAGSILSDIAKAADKLPPRKVKIKTVYGTYEVEHKGELRKRTVDNYRETIEAEGAKQGWARVDGTVADDGAKAVENIKKATPAQYEQAKKGASQSREVSNKPEAQPKKNPADLNKTRKIGPYAQSAIDAYDQSVSEADPMQEYTGGDMRLRRDVNKGKGLNASQQSRVQQPNNLTDVWGLDPIALQDNKANPAGDAEFWNTLKEGINKKIGEQPLVRGINALANTPMGMAMSATANRGADALRVTVPGMNRARAFQDPADQALQTAYDFTVNAPSQLLGSVGNLFDKNVDNIGKAQSGAEIAAAVVPAYMSGKAGFAAYRAAKAAGTPALQALAKGVGTAVADSAGFNHSPESPNVQQVKETLGMGDGAKPTVQGWTPKEDPNYPTSFDPIKAKTQSEKPVWAMTQEEFMSQPRSFDQAPRDMTLNEWRSANNKYVPLSDQGMMRYPHGISKTERRRIDARYAKNLEDLNQSAIEYQQLLNKGEIPKVQPSKWIRADGLDLSNQEAAARVFHKREVLKALKEGKSVPQSVIDSIPALKGMKGTDAKDWAQANIEITPVNDLPYMKGQASSAGADPASGVATPPKPHFTNGDEPTGMGGTKPTPETPGVTTSAPMADLQPNTTGISNAANLDDVEAGLLTEVAKGEGKSAKAVYEANRGREDYLEVAKRVRNGAPLNAEDTATLLAGGQKLTKRVYDTREAVKTAIANGADQATISRLNNDYAEARRVKDEFTQDVQRGKSGWSDVGRVLAQKVEVDTGDIAQVMEEARIRKGAELTDKESVVLKKKVAELQANAVESDKRISDLMDQLVKAQEATRVTRKSGMSRVQTASVREQAKTRFTEARSKAKSVASLNALQGITDPDVIKSFKEYVNAVMDDGARSIQDIVDQMAKDGVTADGEDIYKAFTDKTGMRKLSDIQKELSKARREIVKDAVQGPNITPAQKKIRARIAELENQIKTGDYIEAQPKIKREIDAEVYRLQQIKKMKDAQVKDALEQMRPKSKSEKLNALSSELKLLNPVSRIKDVISNTANLTATMVETPVRYAVDRITARVARQDPIMMLRGSRESAGIANDRIAAVVKTDLGSAWQGLDASATEKFGFTRGIGGRAAGVTDAPFKTVYREYANVRLAEEKARRILPKNATRGDIQNMRDSILANLDDHPDVKLGAEDIALYKTFNNQNAISKFNAMAKRGLNNDTATGFYDELIGRFSKVITNVNLDRLDRTGFGVVRGFTKLLRNKETLTVAERMIINDMISKGLVGMPIVATGYLMSDKIPAEIKDGYRKYIDRGDLGDIGGVVAAFLYGADMKAAEKEGKDANELRFSTTAGLALDNPMSTNLADLFGLMKDPTASGFVDYAAKKATNLIPGGIRETARRMDEPNMQGVPAMVRPQSGQAKEREKYPRGTKARVNKLSADEKSAQAILDMIIGEGKSKIPYLRQTLPEK